MLKSTLRLLAVIVFLLYFIPRPLSAATEEFLEVRIDAGKISFYPAEGNFPFFSARAFINDKGVMTFNHLPERIGVKEMPPGENIFKLEVIDKEQNQHTSFWAITVEEERIASARSLILSAGTLVPVPIGKSGEEFLFKAAGQEKDTKEAVGLFQKFLVLFPGSGWREQALFQLALGYQNLSDYPKAFFYFQKFTKEFPQSEKIGEVRLNLGKILFLYQEYQKAAEVYESTLQYLPADYSGADTGWFTFGVCNSQIQDYEKAVTAFETYLLNYPQNSRYPEATYRLADNYNLAGKVLMGEEKGKKQEQDWQDFLTDEEKKGDKKKEEVNPEKKEEPEVAKPPELSPKEKKEKADKYFNQSYRLFTSFVQFWPDNPFYQDALLSLSILCQRLNRNKESLQYLAKIKGKTQEPAVITQVAFYEGRAHQNLKQHKEAIDLFSGIIAGRDKDYSNPARYHRALSYYLLEDYATSAGEFSQFISLYKQDSLMPMSTYYNLASLFYEYLRKYKSPEVFEQLQAVIEPLVEQLKDLALNYQDTEAGTLASKLAEEGYDILSPDEEMVSFSCPVFDLTSYAKDALAKYPEGPAKALFAEGERLMEEKLYKKAGGCFLAIVNNFPESGLVRPAQYKLGLIYGNLGAYTQGISAFKEVLKIDPKSSLADDSLYLIAYYYMSLESYKNATKYLEKLISAFPDSPRTPWARKDIEIMKQKGLGDAEKPEEHGEKSATQQGKSALSSKTRGKTSGMQ